MYIFIILQNVLYYIIQSSSAIWKGLCSYAILPLATEATKTQALHNTYNISNSTVSLVTILKCLISYRLHIGFQFIVYNNILQYNTEYNQYDQQFTLLMDNYVHKLHIENNSISVSFESVYIYIIYKDTRS